MKIDVLSNRNKKLGMLDIRVNGHGANEINFKIKKKNIDNLALIF